MAGKTVRLSKAAREVNLGIQHVVEFLESKGFDIEAKPNSKLEPEMYDLLLEEFAADRKMKQEVEATVPTAVEERETVAIATAKAKDDQRRAAREEAAREAEAEAAAKAEAEAQAEAAAPAEPEVVKAKAEPLAGPKVVKTIDLDGGKKADEKPKEEVPQEEPSETVAEAPAAEEVKSESPEPVAEAKTESPAEEASEPKAKESTEGAEATEGEPETIRAEAEKLKGTTVVRKIELPVERTPARKKRKRIVKPKVDVEQVGRQARKGPGGPSKKPTKTEISEEEIQKEIKETLARLSNQSKNKGAKLRRAKRENIARRSEEEAERQKEAEKTLELTEFVTVSELGTLMDVPATDIISACMSLGIFASINQRLDSETITLIAEEFGFDVEFISADIQEAITEEEDAPEDLESRPPIVTVMGHVDHGKTSLLDYVRKANVIAGEAGGITQHIGAYQVQLENGKSISFLDTPGHEAFTAMRARGAQVTDVAIIVIAADDTVMPQTKEAINHAQAANVPMVFAINKIDKPGANPDKIKEALSTMNILVEDWGGTYQCQEISAKNGTNIEELMEKVLLEAEMLELKANPERNATGTIIESSLDKGRGYVCTLLVQSGTLRVGDTLIAGQFYGRVKAMFNERGKNVDEAGPATPVIILGMNGAPNAGDKFNVLDDEKEAKNIANRRTQLQREQGVRTQRHVTLDEIGRRIALGEFKELNIVLKGDVDGSIEALTDSLERLSTEKVQVKIIHKAIGQISENDVLLASASDALIIGFQVRPSAAARRLAEKEEVQIKMYSVIYDAIEEVKDAMEGMLDAKVEEQVIGTAEVRETFKISKVGTIAGCFVLDGKLTRNANVRVIRDGIVIYTGALESLKRFKDDAKEVVKGYECGLNVKNFNDIKVGDNIEAYEEVEVKQTLAES